MFHVDVDLELTELFGQFIKQFSQFSVTTVKKEDLKARDDKWKAANDKLKGELELTKDELRETRDELRETRDELRETKLRLGAMRCFFDKETSQ